MILLQAGDFDAVGNQPYRALPKENGYHDQFQWCLFDRRVHYTPKKGLERAYPAFLTAYHHKSFIFTRETYWINRLFARVFFFL